MSHHRHDDFYSSDSDVDPEMAGPSKMSRRALFFCELCDIDCSSIDALQKHFAGTKHKKKLGANGLATNLREKYEISYESELSGKVVECTLCEVIFHGLERAFHFESEKHRALCNFTTESDCNDDSKWLKVIADAPPTASLEEEIMGMDTPEVVADGYFCKLCSTTLMTKTLFQAHIEGKRHQKKARWQYLCLEGDNSEVTQYWCRICNMFCTDRDALTAHYRGRNHLKMLQKKKIILTEKQGELDEKTSPPSKYDRVKVKKEKVPLDRVEVKRESRSNNQRKEKSYRHLSPTLSDLDLSDFAPSPPPPPPPPPSHKEERKSRSSRSHNDRKNSHRSSTDGFTYLPVPVEESGYMSVENNHSPSLYRHDNCNGRMRSRSRSRSRERFWSPRHENGVSLKPLEKDHLSRRRHESSSSIRRDSSSHRRESSAQRRELSPHRRDSSSHQRESSSQRHGSSPHRRDSSAHIRDSSSHQRESSSQRHGSSPHRRDSSAHIRDSSSHRRESSSHRRESSSKRRESSSSLPRPNLSLHSSLHMRDSSRDSDSQRRESSSYQQNSNMHSRNRTTSMDIVPSPGHKSRSSHSQTRREPHSGGTDGFASLEVTSFLQSRKEDFSRKYDERNRDLGQIHNDQIGGENDFGQMYSDRNGFGRMHDDQNDFGQMYSDRNDFGRMHDDRNDFGRMHDDRKNFDQMSDDSHDGDFVKDKSEVHGGRNSLARARNDQSSKMRKDRKDNFIYHNGDLGSNHSSRSDQNNKSIHNQEIDRKYRKNSRENERSAFSESRSRSKDGPSRKYDKDDLRRVIGWRSIQKPAPRRDTSRNRRRSNETQHQFVKVKKKDILDLFDGFSNESSEDEGAPPNASLSVSYIFNALKKSVKKKM